MRSRSRASIWSRKLIAGIAAILLFGSPARAQTPYYLNVHTSTGNDTLMAGLPGSLIFGVDSAGDVPIAAFTWTLQFDFSNGNVFGVISDFGADSNVTFVRPPEFWAKAVRKKGWTRSIDTVVIATCYFKAPYWQGTGEQWRLDVIPSDTGHLVIDSAWSPPANVMSVVTADAVEMAVQWASRTITIVRYCVTGDSNGDSVITAADVIYLINFTFKGGAEPTPCVAIGDVNCSGTITSADIISLVSYIFRGGTRPCYSCGLVDQGVWACP